LVSEGKIAGTRAVVKGCDRYCYRTAIAYTHPLFATALSIFKNCKR
jgi:hypothetical protein